MWEKWRGWRLRGQRILGTTTQIRASFLLESVPLPTMRVTTTHSSPHLTFEWESPAETLCPVISIVEMVRHTIVKIYICILHFHINFDLRCGYLLKNDLSIVCFIVFFRAIYFQICWFYSQTFCKLGGNHRSGLSMCVAPILVIVCKWRAAVWANCAKILITYCDLKSQAVQLSKLARVTRLHLGFVSKPHWNYL